MNKIAKTALMTGVALCVAGVVLSGAGYFAGGKDFTYTSDHMYVSGGNSFPHKNLAVMKKEQIDDFTKLNVDFENFDLDIRTSDDDHYYMEYKLEKNGRKNPLTWKDKDGELTLEESAGGSGSYYITYDLGIFSTHADLTEKKDALNTVILYIPEKAQLSEAELQLSDGDLTVDKLFCKEADVKLSSGDLILTEGEIGDFTAKLGDGDFIADKFKADQMELKNSNGIVKADSAELGAADIELEDGDLNMKELRCTDSFSLKSGNGDVVLKKAVLKDGEISLGDGELVMNNSSFGGDMDIKNSCGDVSVKMAAGTTENTNIYLKASDGEVDASGISTGGTGSDGDEYSMYENKVGGSAPTLNVKCGDGDITLTETDR
jgi:hypothetical protein